MYPSIIVNIDGKNTNACVEDESTWDLNYFPAMYDSKWSPTSGEGFFLGQKPDGSGGRDSYLEVNVGEIGGWEITNEKIWKGNVHINSTNELIQLGAVTDFAKSGSDSGILLGSDGLGAYDFFAGKEDGNYIHWDGSLGVLNISGSITATTGSIGGWAINEFDLTGGNAVLHSSGYLLLGTGDDVVRIDASDATHRLWIGHSTEAVATFSVTKEGSLKASSGTVGGWEMTSTLLRSASSGKRLELDKAKSRVTIFDGTDTDKVVMGYLDALPKNDINGYSTATGTTSTLIDETALWSTNEHNTSSVEITSGTASGEGVKTIASNTGTVLTISGTWTTAPDATSVYTISSRPNYGTGDYGFWARPGDFLYIDGNTQYANGDWIIRHDASYLVQNSDFNTIIRLGTDTGDKGLFLYDAAGTTTLAKFYTGGVTIGVGGGNQINFVESTGILSIETTSLEVTTTNLTLSSTNQEISLGQGTTPTYNSAGIYMGLDSGDYKFSLKSAGGDSLTWDGDDLTISGNISADSGTIGGFTVDATEGLYAGSGITRVQMKAGAGFWAGATAQAGAPFQVNQAGAMTVSNISVTGGDWQGDTIASAYGGTDIFSVTIGDIIVSPDGGSGWEVLPIGTENQVLTVKLTGGELHPFWQNSTGGAPLPHVLGTVAGPHTDKLPFTDLETIQPRHFITSDDGVTNIEDTLVVGDIPDIAANTIIVGAFKAGTYSFPGGLGIGTSSSGNLLQVGGDSDTSNNYIEIATSGANSRGILFTRAGNTDASVVENSDEDLILHYRQSDLSTRELHILRGSGSTSVAVFNQDGNFGIGEVSPDEKLEVGGNIHVQGQGYSDLYDIGTRTTTTTPDWDNGNVQKMVANANITINGGSNKVSGGCYTLIVTSSATKRTLTWPDVDWGDAGTPADPDGNKTLIVTLLQIGSTLYGFTSMLNGGIPA